MQRTSLSLAIVFASIASQAGAGGFALNEQSISALGTANSGRTATAIDASTAYNNPAAMMQLKQAQFTQAVAFIDAQTKITNVAGGFPGGTADGDIVPHTFVPSGYYTSGDKGGWAWGLAAYGSFGLKTNYEPSFGGRVYGDKSDVKVTTIQPTLSYQVNDTISIGIGPTINKIEAYLSSDVGFPAQQVVSLEGDKIAYGYNVGVHANLSEKTQAGLVYRSKVTYNIKGEINGAAPFSIPARTSVTTPESVELGISHALSPTLTAHAGAVWTRWSRLQALNVSSILGDAGSEEFAWENTWGAALGLSKQVNDKFVLRAGLAYDRTPVTEEHLSVRLPSGNRRIATFGVGYHISKNQTIDFTYAYLDESKRNVDKQPSLAVPVPYSATYKNTASLYGLQFTQRF
ncbi:MAG: OmpP1/FadL family transporter [Moraxellaceae bacterium]|nr:OmpP1/FadL family transporter [Moraxellaceae bacterium]MDP1776829.1 OmpP1/FadL family transporter [Moraxellaceae bacterium]